MSIMSSLYDQTLARLYGGVQPQPLMQPRVPGGPSPIQPLDPQTEASVLDRIGGAALGGLGYVGGSLGKALGGRAIRGLIGGRPQEALSIIPFSDTLGITNPANEVTGAELLGNREADFLSPEGLGGMALEIGLDPATYLSFGGSALSKLGQAAKKIGVLPKAIGEAGALGTRLGGLDAASSGARALAAATGQDVAQVAGQRLGGHIGIGLPFAGNAATFDLGPASQALGQALSYVPGAETAKNLGGAAWEATDPLRRGFRSLFDKNVQGMTDPLLQRVMAEKFSPEYAQLARSVRQDVRPLVEQAAQGNLLNTAGSELLGNVLEGAMAPTRETQGIATGVEDLMQRLQREQGNALLPVRQLTPQTILSGEGAGLEMKYAPRQLAKEEFAGKGPRPKVLAPSAQQSRVEATYGLTRSRLAELAHDDMSGLSPLQIEEKIRTDYLSLPQNAHVDLAALKDQLANTRRALTNDQKLMTAADVMNSRGALDPALQSQAAQAELRVSQAQPAIEQMTNKITEMETRLAQAKDLAKYKLEDKVPIFNHPIEDVANKVFRDRERALKADAFHTAVAGKAVTKQEAGVGAMPFLEALQRGGLAPEGSRLMQKTQDALTWLGKDQMALEDMFVKQDDLKPLLRWMEGTRTPAGLQPFIKAWDNVTNLTKAWQTAAWPANWARNFMSDQFMHWIYGGSESPLAQVKNLADAKLLREGGVLQDLNRIPDLNHLDHASALKQVQRELIDEGITGQGRMLADVTGEAGEGIRLQNLIPGQERAGPFEAYKQAFQEGTLNPLDVRGVGGRTEDANKLVGGGRAVNEALYDTSRIQTYLGKRRQGFSAAEAAKAVTEAHYDMGNLSQFERDFVRRVVPFYGWARQNIPTILQEIANEPGGKMATTIKVTGRARGAEPGFLPPQIGEGLALPIGQEESGTKRFLSHLGLPYEDLGLLQTGSDFLGMLNPLIKAPLELATGKQFFTGRDLRDLRSETGSTLLDQIIMNSPAGRLLTTGRTLADERKDAAAKAINVLSGAHISDVDMAKSRDVAVRDYIASQLAGSPNVGQSVSLYARPDQLQNLTPDELLLLRLQASRDRERRQQQQVGIRR